MLIVKLHELIVHAQNFGFTQILLQSRYGNSVTVVTCVLPLLTSQIRKLNTVIKSVALLLLNHTDIL